MNNEELKRGYYFCPTCGRNTLHDWYTSVDMQFYETLAPGEPEPDEVFLCVRCEASDRAQEG